MNIVTEMIFKTDKPAIVSILKNESQQVFAVGLLQGQALTKHKTAIPALLVVQEGSVVFYLNGVATELKRMDTFSIPVDVEHEVVGKSEKSIFLIIK